MTMYDRNVIFRLFIVFVLVLTVGCGLFGGGGGDSSDKDDTAANTADDENAEEGDKDSAVQIDDVVTDDMKNTAAFAAVDGMEPDSALPASALPASALPAAMTTSSSNALPSSARPASFSESAALPEIPPSSAFSADVSGFVSFFFLKNFAAPDIPGGIDFTGLGNLGDADDFIGDIKKLTKPYEQAKLVTKLVGTIMLSMVFIPQELLHKIELGIKAKKIKSTYKYGSALVWFNSEDDPMEFDDDYSDTKGGNIFPGVKLVAQAGQEMELPSFSSLDSDFENFDPKDELEKLSENGLIWSLYVTGAGPRIDVTDFVLMNGLTTADGNRGIWHVFNFGPSSSTDQGPLLTVSYRYHDKQHFVNKITLNKTASKGSFLYFRKSGQIRFFRFHNAKEDKDYTIVLDGDSEHGGGFIKIGSDEKKCWNEKTDTDNNCSKFTPFHSGDRKRALAEDPMTETDPATTADETTTE